MAEASRVGKSALHPDWPEASYNVSGMFIYHLLLAQFLDMMKDGFSCRVPVEAIHGAPAIRWNAGRPAKLPLNVAGLSASLDPMYSRNVGYFATFSNHLIGNEDLSDPSGNRLLEFIAQRPDLNGVIIVSDMLSNYIQRKFPALRQIASIIKVTFDQGKGRTDYYRELGKRFHRYVVHPDDCRDLKLLDQLDRDKAEIIINENCVADCPTRPKHYDAYARLQRALGTPQEQVVQNEINQIVASCHSPLRPNRLCEHRRSCNLDRAELKAIYDMGFRHFKLQGRADDPFTYAYDLVRITLEPEFVVPHVLKSLTPFLARSLVERGKQMH